MIHHRIDPQHRSKKSLGISRIRLGESDHITLLKLENWGEMEQEQVFTRKEICEVVLLAEEQESFVVANPMCFLRAREKENIWNFSKTRLLFLPVISGVTKIPLRLRFQIQITDNYRLPVTGNRIENSQVFETTASTF